MKYFLLTIILSSLFCMQFPATAQNCQCDHTITPDKPHIDGATMNVKPGDVICVKAGKYKFLNLFNFSGTASKPITFINCGGQVVIGGYQHYYGLLLNNVNYFRFTGTGSPGQSYGFKIDGINGSGSGVAGYGIYGEIDHLEISRTGFAGVLYKHDPSCDPTSWQQNFVMKNIRIHDNYIHNTGGEGIYVGYTGGDKTLTCNGRRITVKPHNIEGLKIYNNRIENTGWDGLQVSRATKDCEIYNNTIKNFGTAREKYQDEGILIGGGTTGRLYNNTIIKGTGVGIQVFGSGNNYIYNNVIADVEADGIFCDDRETVPGRGFFFINNTIVNTGSAGMRMYSIKSKGNVFYNNLLANVSKDIVLLNAPIDWKASNNTIVSKVSDAGFADAGSHNYQLKSNSHGIDKGKDVSSYGIRTDRNGKARPAGKAFDIGAYESGASAPGNKAPVVSDAAIMINFNELSENNAADWNNTGFAPQVGKEKSRLKDANQRATGIKVTLLTSWDSSNDKGYSTGNNAARYPDQVIRSYFYTTGQEKILISGLDKSRVYRFTFFASSWFGGNRTAMYNIGNQRTSLNASYNKDKVATLSNIKSDGKGEVTLEVQRASGAKYAFLGALVIEPASSNTQTAASLKENSSQRLTEEADALFKVTAYPNPTDGVLHLKADGSGELPKGTKVSLMNLSGVVSNLTPYLQYERNHIILNTDKLRLPVGVYLLQITTPDGNVSNIRMIKN